MPDLRIYHLTFPHGMHVGRGVESLEDTLEYVPSDTLFAALLDTWRYMGRDVNHLLPKQEEPALKITSAFPFAGEVRFYPKPMDLRTILSDSLIKQLEAGKKIKKIRFLSEKLIQEAQRGNVLDKELQKEENEWACKFSLQNGTLWLTEEEIEQLPEGILYYTENDNGIQKKLKRSAKAVSYQSVYAVQTTPRVTVDRIGNASNLFQSERMMFNEDCGLWFGAVLNSGLKEESLNEMLIVLGTTGLGGERATGYGCFSFEPQPKLSLPSPATHAYLLSRWHPTKNEIDFLQDKTSFYKLESVSGWLRTPESAAAQRRKRVWMVAEGSLIAGNPQGDAPDVCPDYDPKMILHPIYRPGFAVAMDWKMR